MNWPVSNDSCIRIAANGGHAFGATCYGGGNGLWLFDRFTQEWRMGRVQGNGFVVDLQDCIIDDVPHRAVPPLQRHWVYAHFANPGDTFVSYDVSPVLYGGGDPFGQLVVTGYEFKNGEGYNKRLVGAVKSDAGGGFWRAGQRGVYMCGIASLYHPQTLNYHTKVSGVFQSRNWQEIDSNQYLQALMWGDGREPSGILTGSVLASVAGAKVSIGVSVDGEDPPFDRQDEIPCPVAGRAEPFTVSPIGGDFDTDLHTYRVVGKVDVGVAAITGDRNAIPATGASFSLHLKQ